MLSIACLVTQIQSKSQRKLDKKRAQSIDYFDLREAKSRLVQQPHRRRSSRDCEIHPCTIAQVVTSMHPFFLFSNIQTKLRLCRSNIRMHITQIVSFQRIPLPCLHFSAVSHSLYAVSTHCHDSIVPTYILTCSPPSPPFSHRPNFVMYVCVCACLCGVLLFPRMLCAGNRCDYT